MTLAIRVPRTIIRYISGEFAITFGLTLAIITSIWVLGLSIVTVRHEAMNPKAFLAALPWMAVVSLKYTLPMAVLFGASVSYGRMSSENEIRAMEWNGIHIAWVIFPAAVIAVAASLLALSVNSRIIPYANKKLARTIRANLMDLTDRQLIRAAQIRETIAIGSYTLSISGYDPSTRTIDGITVYQTDEARRPVRRIDATRARIVQGKTPGAVVVAFEEGTPETKRHYVTIEFEGGVVTQFDPDSTRIASRYAAPPIAIDLSSEEEKEVGTKGMSSKRLVKVADGAASASDRREARTEYFMRLAFASSPLFFVLLAAPLASLVRWKHNLSAFLPSLGVVTCVYYPLVIWAKVWGEQGRLDPMFGMMAPNAALLVISSLVVFILLRR
jgi:lipopolysaccharide export LptBFGC system permease protein LptF